MDLEKNPSESSLDVSRKSVVSNTVLHSNIEIEEDNNTQIYIDKLQNITLLFLFITTFVFVMLLRFIT